MNQEQLRAYLDRLAATLDLQDRQLLHARLQSLASVFPFNEYEYILMFLQNCGAVSFEAYEELRSNYARGNRYLNLFELAPRIFGQIWGEKHLMDLDPRIRKPDSSLDPDYDGEYDLWVAATRVEVKAARAYNSRVRAPLVSKALQFGSTEPYWMNFQQIKIDICDAFVFIGVWTDRIVYWVLSNHEVKSNPYRSHQHRGGIEYQIGITPRNFESFREFEVEGESIADAIIRKSV